LQLSAPMTQSSSITAVNPLVVIGICILIFLLLVANVYILAYWQDANEKNESYFAKFVIIFSLQLCEMTIMLIPVDVANNEGDLSCRDADVSVGECGGINMAYFWWTLFSAVALLLCLFIPFATFYYEADDGSLTSDNGEATQSKFWVAVRSQIAVMICVAIALVSCYLTVADVEIPIKEYYFQLDDLSVYSVRAPEGSSPYQFIDMNITAEELTVSSQQNLRGISFTAGWFVYMIGILGWVGWWLFSVMAGIGLATIPIDLISDFKYRPKPLAPDKMAAVEVELQRRTDELLDMSIAFRREREEFRMGGAGTAEKRKQWTSDRLQMNKLSQMLFILEEDMKMFEDCKQIKKGYNPLIPYIKLVAGIITLCISILWEAHLMAYVLLRPPRTMLLNRMFEWFDLWFPMFGALCFALFCLYLLFCTLKGFFRVGMKAFCMKLHPMKLGATPVNAFLFNVAMMLLCTIPIVHLCSKAFSGYARFTEILYIFDVHVNNLHFYSLFFQNNIFIWILFVTCPVFMVLSLCCGRREHDITALEKINDIDSRKGMYSRITGKDEDSSKKNKRKKRKKDEGSAEEKSGASESKA
jgi:LMBR1 domain-containing protein 1